MKRRIMLFILLLLFFAAPAINWAVTNPSNSLDLMQTLRNSDNPESLIIDSKNIDYESIKYIQEKFDLNKVSQFTLLEN